MLWRLRTFKNRIIDRVDACLVVVCSSHVLLAKLYYTFWDASFSSEALSVLTGRRAYKKHQGNSLPLLRRNIHRLEKGLLMRPRRSVFAVDYIEETVYEYAKLYETKVDITSIELQWSKSVLDRYFSCVDTLEPPVNRAQKKYLSLEDPKRVVPDNARSPYLRKLLDKPHVSYEALYALSQHRRSVRWFKDIPVERCKISEAVEIGLQSPSACNRQPFKIVVIDDPEMLKRISKIPMGTQGYADNIPALLIFIGDLSCYFSERDRHLIYIDTSLAAMSTIYALETLGLSTCCINWPDIAKRERELSAELHLESHQSPIMLLAVGYADPDGLVAYSAKKTVDEILTHNELHK